MKFNYSQTCSKLLEPLTQKQKAVFVRRFGLDTARRRETRETLESIGKDYGITRERVRQIERDGFLRLRSETKEYKTLFQYFSDYLKSRGELKKEDILLTELGGEKEKNQVYFLLTLGEQFERMSETPDFYPLWTINKDSLSSFKKTIASFLKTLGKTKKPLTLKELNCSYSLSQAVLASYLEVSKKIQKNSEGLFGLKEWPEINPKGVKDKAYLTFKKEGKPLHFNEVASFIDKALPQTVHNELIKDTRFVLVGRGMYALKEWGYEEGYVKDIILKVLKENKKALTKEDILKEVSRQRLVKENTILLNLSNKKYFLRSPEGKYTIKTA